MKYKHFSNVYFNATLFPHFMYGKELNCSLGKYFSVKGILSFRYDPQLEMFFPENYDL